MNINEIAPFEKVIEGGIKVYNVYQLGRKFGHKGLDCTVQMFNKHNPNAQLQFYGDRSRSAMYMDAKQIEAIACVVKKNGLQNMLLDFIGQKKLADAPRVVDDMDAEPADGIPEFDGEYMSSLRLAQIVEQVTGKAKAHWTIMEEIRFMLNSGVAASKFVVGSFIDKQGQLRPAYNLTKKGYLLYVTKFNDRVREQLIDRWEELENGMRKKADKPASSLDILEGMIKALRESNARVDNIDTRLTFIENERERNAHLLIETDTSKYGEAPTITPRAEFRMLVNEYAAATNTPQRDVYHRVYKDMYYKYGHRVNNIEDADKRGLMGECKAVIASLINEARGTGIITTNQ